MIIIIGLYFAFVYLVFFRFRWLPLNAFTKTAIVVLGVFIFLGVITELRTKTPASSQAEVVAYIVEIAPQVSGRIDEVMAQRGEIVEKGTVLFTIDPTLYQSRVDALEAALALSKLRQAQFEELAEADAGSKFQYQQAVAETAQLEAQLVGARFDLVNCEVRAPAKGMVPRMFLRPGQQVSPGRSVLTFKDTQRLHVSGLFQQVALQRVRLGDKASVSFPSLPGRLFESEVYFIPHAIGEGQYIASGQLHKTTSYQVTRQYPILVILPEDVPDEIRKAGVAAVVYIHTEDAGPISGVARMLQWIASSLTIFV